MYKGSKTKQLLAFGLEPHIDPCAILLDDAHSSSWRLETVACLASKKGPWDMLFLAVGPVKTEASQAYINP